ncbi:MAG: nickel pincer cofactor biosynthesis protein LarB [Lachnospiraceae bacterium]|nr:nickel pincer cofactor biosynthesis protein LarB [Lachnospiraceae bacterium]
MKSDIRKILESVRNGSLGVDEAVLSLKEKPFEDIDFAKIDLHRKLRQGTAEVIYGAGKSAQQIRGIVRAMKDNGQNRIMITRLSPEKFSELSDMEGIIYHELAGIATFGDFPKPDGIGNVVVATGGTSDMNVAEEAAVTLKFLGNSVTTIYDVGVSGLHRLLAHLDVIMSATVIIAVAGMEGALASVIGGLADCPVIAVPTSVGYGASFEGLSALLSMLNSCASGVTVVNIDNGFGAGYAADMINHTGHRS